MSVPEEVAEGPSAVDPARSPAALRPGTPAVRVFSAVAGLCVANLYYVLVLLPAMGASLHRTAVDLAPLLSLTQAGYAAGLLFIVPLGDVLDRRRLAGVLLCASCVALVAVPFATGPVLFVLFAVVGLVSVTAMVLVPWGADLAEDATRGRVVGTIMTGLILGALLCRTFAGALAQLAGWRAVYWAAAALMALSAVVLGRVAPASAAGRPGPGPGERTGYLSLLGSLPGIVLRTPHVAERCLYGALGFGAFSVFWTVLPLHLSGAPFHYGPAAIGLFGLLGAAGVAGASTAGRLADRGLQTPITLAAFATAALAFLALGAAPGTSAVMIAGTVLLDFAVQSAHITNQSVVYAGNSANRSRITTAYMVSYFVGGAAGSALAADVWQCHGGWPAACRLGAGFSAVPLVVLGLRALLRRR